MKTLFKLFLITSLLVSNNVFAQTYPNQQYSESPAYAGTGCFGCTTQSVSAALGVNSTTKGFLAPRHTQAQRLAIVSPATGLLVYQTDGGAAGIGFWYNSGTPGAPAWLRVGTGSGTVTSVSGTASRISSTGGATPVIDIAADYVGQNSITTLGTITTGTWDATTISRVRGGTGADLSSTDFLSLGTPSVATSGINFYNSANGNIASITAGVSAGSYTLTLPIDDGAANQFLQTDGNGVLSWAAGGLSGTYTPTLTNVANLDASTAYLCQYTQVGNVVTVSGKVDIDATAGGTPTELGLSLPIASNLSAAQSCAGVGSGVSSPPSMPPILGDAVNNRASFQYTSSGTSNTSYYFTFTYLVE